ncbi:uncharacterized protein LOC128270174 [Anopheles cruzii]|uniref:uncharacterized protein LOC128270174 n=1 Tax=Anopheles cruzii TaxID=68878 RepID=UPI0022EC74EE|nr:uncharacterized protein LOC128270174 [Anopheles cruzii]
MPLNPASATTTPSIAKLDNSIVNRYLSAADDEFVYFLDLDIRRFIERANPKAVLIFPPFNNYRRFLIHKVCASKAFAQHDVVTFSIGVGTERRTVVCFRHQLLQDVKSTTGKSFEESSTGGSTVAAHPQFTSWRSSTTPPTGTTTSITTSSHASAAASCTSSSGSHSGAATGWRRENRDIVSVGAACAPDRMGTDGLTCVPPTGASNRQPQYTIGAGFGAIGEPLKGTGLYGCATSPPKSSAATSIKFPPSVGIYRPPAARRTIKLAESVIQQLAPPAACENPTDYGHHLASTTSPGQQPPVQCAPSDGGNWCAGADKALREPTTVGTNLPDSREGHLSVQGDEPVSETGPTGKHRSGRGDAGHGVRCESRPPQTLSDDSLGSSASGTSITSASRTNRSHRERRPDRAVYIPRARRSLTTPPVTTSTGVSGSGGAVESKVSSTITSTSSTAATCSVSPTKRSLRTSVDRPRRSEVVTAGLTSAETANPNRDCDAAVTDGGGVANEQDKYRCKVPESLSEKSIQICDTVIEGLSVAPESTGRNQRFLNSELKRSHSLEEHEPYFVAQGGYCDRLQSLAELTNGLQIAPNGTCGSGELRQPSPEEKLHQRPAILDRTSLETVDTMHRNNNRNRNTKNATSIQTPPSPVATSTMIINDSAHAESEKFDRDEKELRRASQEINRSNRRIMKQSFNSDVLQIDEPEPPGPRVTAKKVEKAIPPTINGVGTTPSENGASNDKQCETGGTNGEEEDDWESMYDDNGDCLNPKMIDELTSAVGKVAIEVPQSDYKAYQTKQAVLNDEEFPHVLEVSCFPPEFKTQDLMMLFSQYKESGFDIKWVDDTHALAVFSSSKVAAEVLAAGHAFAQVKPLAEATPESRSKARKCASSLQPYRARPVTCAALARRLVTTALGVRLKTAPEERENERRVLREAKERKLLAAKQRDEVWES